MSDIRYLTVTALTRYIKAKLEGDKHLQTLYLRGEISNYKAHSRGHMYFTLKDKQARISCVMFSTHNQRLTFKPQDGMKVLVIANIGLYEAGGNYQLYVREMQQDGIGNLHLAFEELKRRLQEEGLFSPMFKKTLPSYPKAIGVITSPTGAAIRDIITTLNRRYPIAKVVIYPVLVQGENAAASIAKAIKKANERMEVDVLIAGRGGGSIEELWAFNEEIVARSIYESTIPIVSAVGHETDFTIADFVADMRAPTPTGAAELVTPSTIELIERVEQRTNRLIQGMKGIQKHATQEVRKLTTSYAFRYPQQLYNQKEQQLDRVLDAFQRSMAVYTEQKGNQLSQLQLKLQTFHPSHDIKAAQLKVDGLQRQMLKELQRVIEVKGYTYTNLIGKLDALSPLKIMDRGYSLMYDNEKNMIKSVQQLKVGDCVNVTLKDGQANCLVQGIEERM
ncbi:MAG: exodeoxyribonuclease VII large subunit [Bacillaceae bacterium]